MIGVNFPFMVRLAHHEREIRWLSNLHPFALSLSKGERMPAGYVLCRESPNMIGVNFASYGLARALMNSGDVIPADEPTGALDSKSGKEMMAVLHEPHVNGHTIILVTHDQQVAAHAERIIEISDGTIIRDQANPGLHTP